MLGIDDCCFDLQVGPTHETHTTSILPTVMLHLLEFWFISMGSARMLDSCQNWRIELRICDWCSCFPARIASKIQSTSSLVKIKSCDHVGLVVWHGLCKWFIKRNIFLIVGIYHESISWWHLYLCARRQHGVIAPHDAVSIRNCIIATCHLPTSTMISWLLFNLCNCFCET